MSLIDTNSTSTVISAKVVKMGRPKKDVSQLNSPPKPPGGGNNRCRRNKRTTAIPRLSFRRLVEEIAAGRKSDLRIQRDAIEALQEAAENFMTHRFQRCSKLADLCKVGTVRDEHWRFVHDEAAPVETVPA